MNENKSDQELVHKKYQKPLRRTRLDICLDLLRVLKKGVRKPTRIMYDVNISWSPLQKILSSMVSAEFISEIECKGDKRTTRHYEITQSGLNVLDYWDKGKDLLKLMESTHIS